MQAEEMQLWQHFLDILFILFLQWPSSFPKHLLLNCMRWCQWGRKANCASASVEVILGYQSEITSKHCPKFYSSLWQLRLWLPCSWPTVRVAPSLAAVSSRSSLFLLLSVFVSTSVFPYYSPLMPFFFSPLLTPFLSYIRTHSANVKLISTPTTSTGLCPTCLSQGLFALWFYQQKRLSGVLWFMSFEVLNFNEV